MGQLSLGAPTFCTTQGPHKSKSAPVDTHADGSRKKEWDIFQL